MSCSKTKYLLTAVIVILLCFGMTAIADEDRPQFAPGNVIVVTKPQSTGISLFSIQSAQRSALQSVYDELGITDIETLMELPSESSTGGISLFSVAYGTERQILKLTLPEEGVDKVLEAVELLNESGAVEYAQPDYCYYLDSVPDDEKYLESVNNSYHLTKINAQYVWDLEDIDCSTVNVAVIDSGIMKDHEDIKDNLWRNPLEIPDDGIDNDGNGFVDDIHGWDAFDNDNDPTDTYISGSTIIQGHGTHVAGIVSAVTGNGKGVASVAGKAKIVPVRIFNNGVTYSTVIVRALNYIDACNKNGNIIPIANCSFGGTTYNDKYMSNADTVVKGLFQSCSNILFTASAGNGNKSGVGQDNSKKTNYSPIYPATYGFDNIISVAASDSNDKLASFSNYGSTVNIAAPGVGIMSTLNTDNLTTSYGALNGTSQAAPLVASVAAVLKARYPSLTPAQIKTIILNSADQISTLTYGTRKINGNRRLNAQAAIEYADGLVNSVTAPKLSVTALYKGKKITLSTSASGASIYYTTDGSLPTTESNLYSEPFTLYETSEVRAIAVKEDMTDSSVASEKVEVVLPTVDAPQIEIAVLSAGRQVTMTTSTGDASIYYTTDGSDPTTDSSLYTEPFTLLETATVKAIAVSEHMIDSSITSETVVVPVASAPQINTEELYVGVRVEITSDTDEAGIYYTTDGSDPTAEDSHYLEPFILYETGTVKAIAVKETMIDSDITSETVTVQVKQSSAPKIDITELSYGKQITLTTETLGAVIYYTTDGTEPDASSTRYTAPFTVTETAAIKAIALREHMVDSEVTEETVIIIRPSASAPKISIKNIPGAKQITLTSDTSDASIYYTLDGSTPATESELYTDPITLTETATVKAIAVKEGMEDSTVASVKIDIPKAAKPTASHESGEVKAGTVITLATETAGADIYYTTDGSEPDTQSILYDGSVVLTDDVTVKAIAAADGYRSSEIFEAVYTMEQQPVPPLTDKLSISVGSVTSRENSVSVPVYMIMEEAESSGISRLEFCLEYSGGIAFNNITNPGNNHDITYKDDNGSVRVVCGINSPESGILFYLNFDVPKDAAHGEYPLTIDTDSVVISGSHEYELEVSDGIITLEGIRNSELADVSVTLTDKDGNEITSDNIPDEITANIVINDIGTAITQIGVENPVNVILAIYDRQGGLAMISCTEMYLSDLSRVYSQTTKIPQDIEVGAIKFFMWKDIESMLPLSEMRKLIDI